MIFKPRNINFVFFNDQTKHKKIADSAEILLNRYLCETCEVSSRKYIYVKFFFFLVHNHNPKKIHSGKRKGNISRHKNIYLYSLNLDIEFMINKL